MRSAIAMTVRIDDPPPGRHKTIDIRPAEIAKDGLGILCRIEVKGCFALLKAFLLPTGKAQRTIPEHIRRKRSVERTFGDAGCARDLSMLAPSKPRSMKTRCAPSMIWRQRGAIFLRRRAVRELVCNHSFSLDSIYRFRVRLFKAFRR